MLRVYQEKKGSLVDVVESDGPDRSSSPQSATARVPHELCLGPAGEILVPAPGAVGPQRLATLRRDEFCERRCYGHHGYALTGGACGSHRRSCAAEGRAHFFAKLQYGRGSGACGGDYRERGSN